MGCPQALGAAVEDAGVLMRDMRTAVVVQRGRATIGTYVIIRQFYLMVLH